MASEKSRKRAAFLDRDGVINRKAPEGEYVTRWEEMHFLPRVAEAIRLLNRAGFVVIVVSNQRCVAKGLLSIPDLQALHRQMSAKLAADGGNIDGIYYCPHDYEDACVCRKPAPGMLIEAAQAHGIELEASWMIGDSLIDIEAGRAAGCKTAQVRGHAALAHSGADIDASTLLDAVERILRSDRVPTDSISNERS